MARLRRPPRRPPRPEEPAHRINERIRAKEVRVVGLEEYKDQLGKEDDIYPIEEALEMAKTLELDLVQVAPNAKPPVCKIMEYSKFRYEQKKREKAAKAKQHTMQLKEIRFGPNTDDHDFNFKLRHAQKFLSEGNKLKAYVQFRGRSIVHKERGLDLLKRFEEELEDYGKTEQEPKMEGRRMIMIMSPAKKKN